ncbi:hypothetical protein EZS27_035614, partial [termite gut metagenome]
MLPVDCKYTRDSSENTFVSVRTQKHCSGKPNPSGNALIEWKVDNGELKVVSFSFVLTFFINALWVILCEASPKIQFNNESKNQKKLNFEE